MNSGKRSTAESPVVQRHAQALCHQARLKGRAVGGGSAEGQRGMNSDLYSLQRHAVAVAAWQLYRPLRTQRVALHIHLCAAWQQQWWKGDSQTAGRLAILHEPLQHSSLSVPRSAPPPAACWLPRPPAAGAQKAEPVATTAARASLTARLLPAPGSTRGTSWSCRG